MKKSTKIIYVYVLILFVLAIAGEASGDLLTFLEVQKNGQGGVNGLNGAYAVVISPDGKNVYATGYNDATVVVFSRNTDTGRLTFVEAQKDGRNGVDGLDSALWVTVSTDGKYAYATGNFDDTVAVFSLPLCILSSVLAGTGSGSVFTDPSGINCPGTCENTFLTSSLLVMSRPSKLPQKDSNGCPKSIWREIDAHPLRSCIPNFQPLPQKKTFALVL
jgi:hypothetical protein